MKYPKSTTLGYKDIRIIKSDFVAKFSIVQVWCMNCEQSAKSANYHNCTFQNNLLEFKSANLESVWDYSVSLGFFKVSFGNMV